MTGRTIVPTRLARGVLVVLPPALQVGVRVLDGAVTALRGLVLVATFVPIFTVVMATLGAGRIGQGNREGGR